MTNTLIRNFLFQVQKRFLQASAIPFSSTYPLPTTTSSSSFTVQYLVNSCGLPLESAISASQNDTHVAKLIAKWPPVLQCRVRGNLQPKFEYLMKNGFVAIMQKKHRMVYAVNAVKNLGLQPTSRMFVHAVRVMISMSESTWKKKIELLKSIGWSEEKILSAFVRDPLCLACSEEKIKNVMDFYMNTMKLEPHTIIAYPKFLTYAVDKRLRPRYDVLKVLESKKLIEGNRKIEWLFTITEKNFMKNYVNRYADEVPGLLEMYVGANKAKYIGTS
ncbi:hypothetical protein P3X46_033971 [Hevea brasiliensis]|uniref:Uncharacterized protein n=1 Tax=Hevea brasiliensis TaxID=3981 RepID=A0ABQ9KAN3_HEVBR|nr:hypothetical protein P3X46_033971 [Hevea brasiliensis]